MSNMFIPLLCVTGILLAPMLNKPQNKPFTRESKGVVRSTEFVLKVTDVATSNSGVIYCKLYNERTDSKFIGPCSTTDDMKLTVGSTYSVTKSNISKGDAGNTISINKAELIESGGARLRVIETFVRARSSLARLENGQIIGGENLSVGDLVSVN